MKPAILVTGADLAPQAVALLEGFDLVYAGKAPGEEDLVRICGERQPVAIIVRYGKISARVIDAAKKLRVIAKHGVGIDTIDTEAAAARGIVVKAATGANAAAVAEHAWALILACAKSVARLNDRMHAGHWDKASHKSLELEGRTLGVVGVGAIGERVARVAIAFGMRVIGYDPYAKEAPAGIALVTLEALLTEADIVSLHCPLTAANRNMLSREALSRMRDGAILVNTARGGLVDEPALLAALKSGKLRAAGLDCFADEPVIGPHAFSGVPNAILSPHIGGVSAEAYANMGVAAARNILTVLDEAGQS